MTYFVCMMPDLKFFTFPLSEKNTGQRPDAFVSSRPPTEFSLVWIVAYESVIIPVHSKGFPSTLRRMSAWPAITKWLEKMSLKRKLQIKMSRKSKSKKAGIWWMKVIIDSVHQ